MKKNVNISDEGIRVLEFDFYDEYLKRKVEAVLIWDNKKFFIVASNGVTTDIKEYNSLEGLLKDFIKSESKLLLYKKKIKDLKEEINELYK